MYRQSEKYFFNSNISSTWPYNMANFGPLAAEIGRVWAPQLISTAFASWQCYCSDVADRRPTKLCTMSGCLLGGTLYIHFRGLLPPDGILPGALFTLRPSLAFSYIDSVTARHSSSRRQPNFAAWYTEWNHGTFVDGATFIWLGDHHDGHRPTL